MRNESTYTGYNFRQITRRDSFKFALGSLATLALGSGRAEAQPKRGGVLRVAFYTAPSSLDPIIGNTAWDKTFMSTYLETLIDFDARTLLPKPGLAEAWESPTPNQLVLHLRKGVLFQDGTAFDAEAVKFNIERAKSHERSRIKSDLQSVEGVEINGEHVVTLQLARPDSALPVILSDRAGFISSPTAIEERGENYERAPVGTGRWKFVRYVPDQSLVVDRNTSYRLPDLPHLDGIEINIIRDTNTGLRSLIAGENDLVVRVPARNEAGISENPSLAVATSPSMALYCLLLRYGRPPFDDLRVRQAIGFATNRPLFNQIIGDGRNEIAWGLFPEGTWMYDASLTGLYDYDIEAARRLMSEAGHPNGFTLDAVGYNDQDSQRIAEVLIEQLKAIGIDLRFRFGTIPDATATWSDGVGEIYLARFANRPDPAQAMHLLYGETSFLNAADKTPPPEAFKRAIEEDALATTPETRNFTIGAAQRVAIEEALTVPMVFDRLIDAHSANVKNYVQNVLGTARFDDVYLEQG